MKASISCALFLVLTGTICAAENPLKKLDRKIVEEPDYVSAPRYGLYVLDVANQTRIWAVLDKSTADSKKYDVLYFDSNADGKLTDEGERFQSDTGKFDLGQFTDPNTGDVHTNLYLRINSKESVMFGLNWNGKHKVAGGYAEEPGPYTMFAESPAKAPVIKAVGEGAFQFQTWMAPKALTIGGEGYQNDIKFFLGYEGIGSNTFSSVIHPFLPKDVALEATLVYQTKDGKQVESLSRLEDRC